MLHSSQLTKIFACLALALSAGVYVACTDDGNVGKGGTLEDGGPLVDGGLPPGVDCFPDPKTHDEIINACTDAARVDKHPVLPLLLADGGLPPLP